MRRSRAPSIWPGPFFDARFWAGCTTDMFGFDLRQAQHDCPIAGRLIRRVKPSKHMLGDKAYDSAELREELNERGTKPVIPNRSNRKQPLSFSKRLYKLRWRIESPFNRFKYFRRFAPRYDVLT